MKMENTILKVKPVEVLIELLNNDLAIELNRKTLITYAHIIKLLKKFEEKGLISREKRGRTRIINLTTKGLKIVRELKLLRFKLANLKRREDVVE